MAEESVSISVETKHISVTRSVRSAPAPTQHRELFLWEKNEPANESDHDAYAIPWSSLPSQRASPRAQGQVYIYCRFIEP